jgi:hypothetical protein
MEEPLGSSCISRRPTARLDPCPHAFPVSYLLSLSLSGPIRYHRDVSLKHVCQCLRWVPVLSIGGGAPVFGADAPPQAVPAAEEATRWQKVEPVPRRFGRITDKNGCRWGLRVDGSVGLSGHAEERVGAFDWAHVLAVDGRDFTMESAETSPERNRVRLRGKAGDVEVTRDVWIDPERGGVRFIEAVTNSTDALKTIEVLVRTEFGDGVQPLQRLDGRPLAENQLGKDDAGVLFMQESASKKPAVLMLLTDPRSESKPRLSGSNTSQRWQATWTLRVPAKTTASIVHWLVQRANLTADQARPVVEAFWHANKLLRPEVDGESAKTLVNFSPRSVGGASDASAAGPDGEQLLGPLSRLCERLSVERGKEDVYWMGAGSALTGEVQGGPLTVESRFGKLTLPLVEVAAVQGAGGRGRWPRVFLRDGTVLPGALVLPDWKVIGAKGWTIKVASETLEALVLRVSPIDGIVTPPPTAVARLTSGEVLPLQIASEEKLRLTSPWGPVETTLAQIEALWHLRQPAPACRLWLKDGSRLTVFPAPREITARSARLGAIPLKISDLAALWSPAADLPDFDADLEEITDLSAHNGSACLLKGSNLIAATLADPSLILSSGTTETSVKATEIRELRRLETGSDAAPVFHLTLDGGAEFDGVIEAGTIALQTATGPWHVPVAHLLALKYAAP